jgi:hypothetical protein
MEPIPITVGTLTFLEDPNGVKIGQFNTTNPFFNSLRLLFASVIYKYYNEGKQLTY